jgi:hypothetical protein
VQINHYKTAGNATIFEANSVETGGGLCRVRLGTGGWAQLGARSSGRFFSDRVELDQGSVRVSGYDAMAAGLRVRASEKGIGTVAIRNEVVEVSSIEGVLLVYNANGANVAKVQPGHTVNLAPGGADNSRAYSVTGCIVGENGRLYVTDKTSNIKVELQGSHLVSGLEMQVIGSEVEGGKGDAADVQRVIRATAWKQVSPAACSGPKTPAPMAALMRAPQAPSALVSSAMILRGAAAKTATVPVSPAISSAVAASSQPATVAAPRLAMIAADVAPVSVPASVAGGVKVFPTFTAFGISGTKAHGEGDDDDEHDRHCISADRDCDHGHGNGHGNGNGHGDDNGHGGGNGHGDDNGHGGGHGRD